jgi:hypothetical protein
MIATSASWAENEARGDSGACIGGVRGEGR